MVKSALPKTSLNINKISKPDGNILRSLASRIADLAARPGEEVKRQLWYRHNSLEATPPLIFCDPENGWGEIITPEMLACQGELARQWEWRLRREIFWGEQMGDDRVVEAYFDIPHVYSGLEWGLVERRIGGDHGGAYRWDAPIKTEADLEKLHFPTAQVDEHATLQLAEQAEEIFGTTLKVRVKTSWWWTLGMTQTLAHLRGLEQIMVDMIEAPDFLHRLMGFLRDGTLSLLDELTNNNLLSLNCDGTYVGSGGFGWTRELPGPDFRGVVRPCDMWGFAESQETIGVSPRMFAEFIFPYQVSVLDKFGLNCYGCCEPIDTRWHIVQQIPRLRRVSVSPWSNRSRMAELLGDQYIFSMKPNPADLAMTTFDEDRIRLEMRQALQQTRNCRVEVIMKDNHTINHDPQRILKWVKIVRQETEGL